MENKTSSHPYSKSQMLFLPFITAPATKYDTVYTALLTAVTKCKSVNQSTCFVNFDQLLYLKAREIVASNSADPDLSAVIVRLGGFHLLMSFLGAIGYIMDGSGLQDVFSVTYAHASTEKMLSGHAYSRSVRAHTLCNLAIAHTILKKMTVSEEETTAVLNAAETASFCGRFDANETIENIMQRFATKIEQLEQGGPTAKLWVQYFI